MEIRFVKYAVLCVCMLYGTMAFAQQPLTPVPLPTHDQLELRLADNAMSNQRALCATLWQQGNEMEQQLAKLKVEHEALKEEHAKLKVEHEALKEEHAKLKEEHAKLHEPLTLEQPEKNMPLPIPLPIPCPHGGDCLPLAQKKNAPHMPSQ